MAVSSSSLGRRRSKSSGLGERGRLELPPGECQYSAMQMEVRDTETLEADSRLHCHGCLCGVAAEEPTIVQRGSKVVTSMLQEARLFAADVGYNLVQENVLNTAAILSGQSRDGSPMSPSSSVHCPAMDGVHECHHPGSPRYIHPSRWCVTLQDLDFFEFTVRQLLGAGRIPDTDNPKLANRFHDDPAIGPTIHQVVKHYIQPETLRRGGMSWALMRNPKGLDVDVFASHCWQEGVFEFISKVRRNWPRGARNLWACFFANPQNGNLQLVLQGDLRNSPFARALRRSKHLLVIPNKNTSIYTRLWCVYEAYLSLRYVARNDLVVLLPSEASKRRHMLSLGPGLLLWLLAAVVSFFCLAPMIGNYLPPLFWLVSAIVVSLIHMQICRALVVRCRPRPGGRERHGSCLTEYEEIFIAWTCLAIVGVGFGLLQYVLRHERTWTSWQWEEGEGWACGFFTASVVLMHSRSIINVISAAVRRQEGVQLDFETVRDALCSVKDDEARIRTAIKGFEDQIDIFINTLRVVGRFDRDVYVNLRYGMSAERARDGLATFRVITACCAWTYWWVTDLSAHLHHIFATEVVLACCVIALVTQQVIGEKAIFAMDMFFYCGLAYVVMSILFVRFEWGSEPLVEAKMSKYTLGLQVLFFIVMLFLDAWYYSGYHAMVCQRIWSGCPALDLANCAEDDYDSDESDSEESSDRFHVDLDVRDATVVGVRCERSVSAKDSESMAVTRSMDPKLRADVMWGRLAAGSESASSIVSGESESESESESRSRSLEA